MPVSERYVDPRAELLQGDAWEAAREAVARALDRSTDPHVELMQLQAQVQAAYKEVSADLAHNTALEVRQENGQPYVVVTPLVAQPESEQLQQLRTQLTARLPTVELAALLLEVQAFTGFADSFTHVADGQTKVADLPRTVCAVLLAQACNIGLPAVARANVAALTYLRLAWAQQHYVRAETLTAANSKASPACRWLNSGAVGRWPRPMGCAS